LAARVAERFGEQALSDQLRLVLRKDFLLQALHEQSLVEDEQERYGEFYAQELGLALRKGKNAEPVPRIWPGGTNDLVRHWSIFWEVAHQTRQSVLGKDIADGRTATAAFLAAGRSVLTMRCAVAVAARELERSIGVALIKEEWSGNPRSMGDRKFGLGPWCDVVFNSIRQVDRFQAFDEPWPLGQICAEVEKAWNGARHDFAKEYLRLFIVQLQLRAGRPDLAHPALSFPLGYGGGPEDTPVILRVRVATAQRKLAHALTSIRDNLHLTPDFLSGKDLTLGMNEKWIDLCRQTFRKPYSWGSKWHDATAWEATLWDLFQQSRGTQYQRVAATLYRLSYKLWTNEEDFEFSRGELLRPLLAYVSESRRVACAQAMGEASDESWLSRKREEYLKHMASWPELHDVKTSEGAIRKLHYAQTYYESGMPADGEKHALEARLGYLASMDKPFAVWKLYKTALLLLSQGNAHEAQCRDDLLSVRAKFVEWGSDFTKQVERVDRLLKG